MTVSDPIADLLTRIRNAIMAKHRYVDLPLSKMKQSIAQILKENGFVEHILVDKEKARMRIFLKYNKQQRAVIRGLKRISRPSVRQYVGHSDIPTIMEGLGIVILTTSQGLMSGTEAKKKKIGGELICSIW